MNQPRRSMLDQKKSSPNLSRSSCAAKQPSSSLTAFQQCAKLTTFLFSKKVKLLKQANTTNYSKSKVANTVVSTNFRLVCISRRQSAKPSHPAGGPPRCLKGGGEHLQ